jgi:hypothetical protein
LARLVKPQQHKHNMKQNLILAAIVAAGIALGLVAKGYTERNKDGAA